MNLLLLIYSILTTILIISIWFYKIKQNNKLVIQHTIAKPKIKKKPFLKRKITKNNGAHVTKKKKFKVTYPNSKFHPTTKMIVFCLIWNTMDGFSNIYVFQVFCVRFCHRPKS